MRTRSSFYGAIVMVLAGTAYMLSAAGGPDTPAAVVEVRVVQLNAETSPATTKPALDQEAVQVERLTDGQGGATVYVAPAARSILLADHVLAPRPASRSEPHESTGADIWREVSVPRVVCNAGQAASVRVGASVPYMTKRPDGSLIVEQSEAVEGVVVDLRVGEVTKTDVDLAQLSVNVTRIVGREPIPGVPFDVGRPIVRTQAVSASLRLAADKVAVIALPTGAPDEKPVFVLVTARAQE